MNVIVHSVYSLFPLLGAAIFYGLFLSCIYMLLEAITYLPNIIKCGRFPTYRDFRSIVNSKSDTKIILAFIDIIFSIISILLFLCITFLYNSGIYRLLPLLGMFIAFRFGVFINNRLLRKSPQSLLLFLTKWCVSLVLYPFLSMVKILIDIIHRIIEKRRSLRFQKSMKKYTSYRFNRIEKDAAYGLLDEYYKEFIK